MMNSAQPKLSIIVPIYNEEKLLPEVLHRLRALEWSNKEIILVNDCSTDKTEQILEPEKSRFDTLVLKHEVNMGKGAAIRTGLRYITGEIVIIQDADLEYDPAEILQVVAPIARGEVGVCYGSRFMGQAENMRLQNRIANWLLAQLVSWLFWYRITDEATAYKAFHRDVIERIPLECHGFEFCPEVTSKILKLGIPIKEVPVHFQARTIAEGKKIGWWDFVVAVWTILAVRIKWSTRKAIPPAHVDSRPGNPNITAA